MKSSNMQIGTIPRRGGLVKRRAGVGLKRSSIFSPCLLNTFWLEKVLSNGIQLIANLEVNCNE